MKIERELTLGDLEREERKHGASLVVEKMILTAAQADPRLRKQTSANRQDILSDATERGLKDCFEYDGKESSKELVTRWLETAARNFQNRYQKKEHGPLDTIGTTDTDTDAPQTVELPAAHAETAEAELFAEWIRNQLSEMDLTDEERLTLDLMLDDRSRNEIVESSVIISDHAARKLIDKLRKRFAHVREDLCISATARVVKSKRLTIDRAKLYKRPENDLLRPSSGYVPFNARRFRNLRRAKHVPPKSEAAIPEEAAQVRAVPRNITKQRELIERLQKWLGRYVPESADNLPDWLKQHPDCLSFGDLERGVLEYAARAKNEKIVRLWHRAQRRYAIKLGIRQS